ncbi:hypothetical protein TURU_013208 [Turdus rufiventris]|nr:hypothetical protein TURU_013208 [Turdus rufiventris]
MVTFMEEGRFSHRSNPYAGRHSSILSSLQIVSRLPKFNFCANPLLYNSVNVKIKILIKLMPTSESRKEDQEIWQCDSSRNENISDVATFDLKRHFHSKKSSHKNGKMGKESIKERVKEKSRLKLYVKLDTGFLFMRDMKLKRTFVATKVNSLVSFVALLNKLIKNPHDLLNRYFLYLNLLIDVNLCDILLGVTYLISQMVSREIRISAAVL